MNRLLALATIVLTLAVVPEPVAAQSDSEMRTGFQAIIDGLNDNTFRKFHDAIDDREFANRAAGTRVIAAEAREAFSASVSETVETTFVGAFPRPRNQSEAGEIIGTVIAFDESGGQGRAIVRFESTGYRFSYHSYDLVSGRGGRVQIVDWFDYYQGSWFSEDIGNMLVRTMPGKESVASLLEMTGPSDAQLFQVGELLKAVRDQNPRRYFQIYDGLEEALRAEPYVVMLNFSYSRHLGDRRRMDEAVKDVVANLPGDARLSLSLADYYIMRRRFAEAITEYERFQDALGMKDGASESMKATAAMALGEFDRAQAFALSATEVEPTLELGWWTLLRTRTAAEDYSGATEAMTQLEDRFGHLLIPQKLRRDRFLRALIDQQAYKDWRASRDAT